MDIAIEALREALYAHVAQWVGPIAGGVTVDTAAGPIELLHVPATAHKPFQVLLTAGMSFRPMTVPEDEAASCHAELMLSLPADWPVDEAHLSEVRWSWPLRLLATTAAFPYAYEGWLAPGHTLPNGDPPQPYVIGLDFCGVLITPPLTLLSEARRLRVEDQDIDFFGLVPVFEREIELKRQEGAGALLARFDQRGVSELLQADRRSAAGLLLDILDGAKVT